MKRTHRENFSFKEKMGRLLADAGTGKRQVEYRDVFRYFKPKELKEEELDRVLDILAENQVQILDGEEERDDPETESEEELAEKMVQAERGAWDQADPVCLDQKKLEDISSDSGRGAGSWPYRYRPGAKRQRKSWQRLTCVWW